MDKKWSLDSPVGKILTKELRCPNCGTLPTDVVATLQVYGITYDEVSNCWEPAVGPDQRAGSSWREYMCTECDEVYDVSNITFVIDDALEAACKEIIYNALQEEYTECSEDASKEE